MCMLCSSIVDLCVECFVGGCWMIALRCIHNDNDDVDINGSDNEDRYCINDDNGDV